MTVLPSVDRVENRVPDPRPARGRIRRPLRRPRGAEAADAPSASAYRTEPRRLGRQPARGSLGGRAPGDRAQSAPGVRLAAAEDAWSRPDPDPTAGLRTSRA